MIIASILPCEEKDLLILKDLQAFPEYVEVRLDEIGFQGALDTLRDLPVRKIAACRREEDGGSFRGSDDERVSILERAIGTDLFDIIDVEMGSKALVLLEKYPNRDFIISHHDVKETPGDLTTIYRKLISRKRVFLYKIVTKANTLADNLRIREIIREAESDRIPLIAFCMGRFGMASRILALSWGSKGVYASLAKGRETAPGQISYGELLHCYDIGRIGKETRLFGILGYPLGHSLSPLIHNAAYRAAKLDYACIPFETDSPKELFDHFAEFRIDGCAVTAPHKETVMQLIPRKDEDAAKIGSANTVITRESQMIAANTDWKAFFRDFEERIPDLRHERVAVLGDGGAARAVSYALMKNEARFRVFSRNRAKGEMLGERFHTSWYPLEDLQDFNYTILVNCTSAGMYPDTDGCPIGDELLKGRLVYDLIYNPPATELMKRGVKKGMKACNGRKMFLRQAALQFKLLTGQNAPERVMEKAFDEGMHFLDFE